MSLHRDVASSPLCQRGDASLYRGNRLFDLDLHSVYIWYTFGLFSVYDPVLNMILSVFAWLDFMLS